MEIIITRTGKRSYIFKNIMKNNVVGVFSRKKYDDVSSDEKIKKCLFLLFLLRKIVHVEI